MIAGKAVRKSGGEPGVVGDVRMESSDRKSSVNGLEFQYVGDAALLCLNDVSKDILKCLIRRRSNNLQVIYYILEDWWGLVDLKSRKGGPKLEHEIINLLLLM